ncbi:MULTISPECIES: signal recognition particle-docking protein FtsY [unclassified Halomonas]|uniref:signal recognition particle-docking protein FtsY n=1 Tax=unclassified Halomonas TaxID=2609666 RepID=UPI002883D6F0|nr:MULTISPECIES: signal recognition particle-docking protein FtsY [unclassified Halomonas]MDT0502272.1 signal recognition particle-docking protein FtsY [Halomonas sp. PAR7]MDT0512013.1 signal recognition particle-docking protein FtsY [Halomonas sp. LES1]MDT0590850.1 signal recognition particle-docking protein FtsY [Halomonas sp. PAR8]
MFGFFKRKKKQEQEAIREEQELQDEVAPPSDEEEGSGQGESSDQGERPVDEERPNEEGRVAETQARPESHPVESSPAEVTEASSEDTAAASASIAPDPIRQQPAPEPEPEPEPEPAPEPTVLQEKPAAGEKKGWFARIRSGLGKTRANLTDGLADLFLGKKQIDDDLMEDLETQLLMADVGIEATTAIIDRLAERVSRKELKDSEALYRALQEELALMLESVSTPLELPPKGEGPFVILVVGVNGVGKTTTIGKLTQRFQREGRSVMLAAGDTFRAAAVEQLKVWGERNRVPVIAQHTGADSASVVYDAVAAAKARGVDVLIADTAGRLHNKAHLMEELKKVHRVMGKLDASAPHEVMLVLDAGTGQNALSQASTFNEAVPITGVTLTKLDGTAKGGIIFALAKQLGTPIRFIGVGESLDDLRPFVAGEFVDALFDRERNDAQG